MGNNRIFMAQMEALQDNRSFTIRKKLYPLRPEMATILHWHDFYEIELITGGKGVHLLNGSRYELHRGCVYLLSPKDFHSISEDPDNPLQLYNINFGESVLYGSLMTDLNTLEEPIRFTFEEEEFCRLETIAKQLLYEYEHQNPYREEMIASLFQQTIVKIFRQNRENALPADIMEKPNIPVNCVISYLKQNFRQPITLNECAKMVCLTPNYLGEVFHRSTRLSFSEYLKHLRFTHALNLLNSTQSSVEEISKLSGFHSAAYFIVLFRESFGFTPSQYRKLDYGQRTALMREKLKQLQHL